MTLSVAWKPLSQRIDAAARRAGRDPATIRCVAVSKGVAPDRIREAVAAGVTIFGENRIQEARNKFSEETIPSWRTMCPALSLHLMGSLQSNKVRKAVGFFDLIHSVDSLALAEKMASEAAAQSRVQPILIQVNVSGEKTKHGLSLSDVPEVVETLRTMPSLRVDGLMTIAPHSDDPESSRPYFARLYACGMALGLSQFSMGMSDDFEVAIEEGATWIRVGTALFGPRTPVAEDGYS